MNYQVTDDIYDFASEIFKIPQALNKVLNQAWKKKQGKLQV